MFETNNISQLSPYDIKIEPEDYRVVYGNSQSEERGKDLDYVIMSSIGNF